MELPENDVHSDKIRLLQDPFNGASKQCYWLTPTSQPMRGPGTHTPPPSCDRLISDSERLLLLGTYYSGKVLSTKYLSSPGLSLSVIFVTSGRRDRRTREKPQTSPLLQQTILANLHLTSLHRNPAPHPPKKYKIQLLQQSLFFLLR